MMGKSVQVKNATTGDGFFHWHIDRIFTCALRVFYND